MYFDRCSINIINKLYIPPPPQKNRIYYVVGILHVHVHPFCWGGMDIFWNLQTNLCYVSQPTGK